MTGRQNEISQAIGNVALADAEVDEWLHLLLCRLLMPLDEERVTLLFRSEPEQKKIGRIRLLLEQRGIDLRAFQLDSGSIRDLFSDLDRLREQRSQAIHSFYDLTSAPTGVLRSHRSRDATIVEVSVSDVLDLAHRIRSRSEDLGKLLQRLEELDGEAGARRDFLGGLMEDARELLVVARQSQSGRLEILKAAFEAGPMKIAMRGHGRWRLLGDELAAEDEALATLDASNGQITLLSPDGTEVHGGDTGWRNITENARESDPDIEELLIRRINGSVYCAASTRMEQGGQVKVFDDSLNRRVFNRPSLNDPLPAQFLILKDLFHSRLHRSPSGKFELTSLNLGLGGPRRFVVNELLLDVHAAILAALRNTIRVLSLSGVMNRRPVRLMCLNAVLASIFLQASTPPRPVQRPDRTRQRYCVSGSP